MMVYRRHGVALGSHDLETQVDARLYMDPGLEAYGEVN